MAMKSIHNVNLVSELADLRGQPEEIYKAVAEEAATGLQLMLQETSPTLGEVWSAEERADRVLALTGKDSGRPEAMRIRMAFHAGLARERLQEGEYWDCLQAAIEAMAACSRSQLPEMDPSPGIQRIIKGWRQGAANRI
jgi:hypothetical protein